MHAVGYALQSSAVLLITLGIASCTGDRLLGSYEVPAPARAPPTTASVPPVNIAGRWLLTSPGRGQCHMTFGAVSPSAGEGTIAPAAGCPGKFFTSRKWTFEQSSLVIRDHTGMPLAQLTRSGAGFDGMATSGEPVALIQ
jgi:hypothetical protein